MHTTYGTYWIQLEFALVRYENIDEIKNWDRGGGLRKKITLQIQSFILYLAEVNIYGWWSVNERSAV